MMQLMNQSIIRCIRYEVTGQDRRPGTGDGETGLTADGPTVPMVLVSPRKVHADQADIDTPLVRELVAAQFPQWSVHRWLSGTHPSPDAVADPRRLATDLAAFVDAFRRIDLPDRPPAYPGERRTRAPMVSMDSSTRKAIGELDGLIDTRAALASWEESLAAPYDGRELWVHSDLTPSNMLVSAEGRLTAVLDFETCGVGDPACDLFPVWYLLPASVRDEFRAALDVDDATWLRGRGRVLSQALIVLAYHKDTNPALANDLRHVIGEVLAAPR